MHTSLVPGLHATPKHIDVKSCLAQHGGSRRRTLVGSAHGNNAVTFDGRQLVDPSREFKRYPREPERIVRQAETKERDRSHEWLKPPTFRLDTRDEFLKSCSGVVPD